MASGGGSDSAGTTALLTERNSLAARVTELEAKTKNLEENLSDVTEEKNVLHRQLGQVKEVNIELEDKVKVMSLFSVYRLPVCVCLEILTFGVIDLWFQHKYFSFMP